MNISNEYILIVSLIGIYASILLWFYIFGQKGLMCFTAIATIAANIEVLIVIRAFGMEQTLGNILFASTFLITDILSEVAGKKEAQTAVNIGIFTSITFVLLSQSWLLYTPASTDWAFPNIQSIFSNTPRLMFASLIIYVITQKFDVWAYHKWWAFTEKLTGDRRKLLWVRNNGSTLISQFFNTFLFTFLAFYGMYDMSTLWSIVFSSYIIFVATSLADTPVVYLARKIADKRA
ncbi:MAG: queuosine precursor transporter [Velocimicrobium sp.]